LVTFWSAYVKVRLGFKGKVVEKLAVTGEISVLISDLRFSNAVMCG